MFSATSEGKLRSAAWRISLWGTLWFAAATLLVFEFLHHSMARETEDRTDVWVAGEAQTMAEVLRSTPRNAQYASVVREIEELASREIPDAAYDGDGDDDAPLQLGQNDSVIFLQVDAAGKPVLWVGPGDGSAFLPKMEAGMAAGGVFDLHLPGERTTYRVAAVKLDGGGREFLGVSKTAERNTLRKLKWKFLLVWLGNVVVGFGLLFLVTSRLLRRVRNITQAASRIGQAGLAERVPVSADGDEVTELAQTLNGMLERIERSVEQLRVVTNALAHDLRSPLTAIRAKLEMAAVNPMNPEPVGSAIEAIDQLNEMLTQTLDVAEAQAGALRVERERVDLREMVSTLVDLYGPAMSEHGLRLEWLTLQDATVMADPGLLHRMIANLLDNEMKHVRAGRQVWISLYTEDNAAVLVVEDDGPGFAPEVLELALLRGVKERQSKGYGLGLAFAAAVASAHGGSVKVMNRAEGGARIRIELPWSAEAVERVTIAAGVGE